MSTLLVTGASRGVGLSVVERALARGDRVVAVARRGSEALDRALSDVAHSQVVRADLRSDAAVPAIVAACQAFEAVDGVCLAAGISVHASFEADVSEHGDPLTTQLALDLESPLRLLRGLLRAECLAAGASIVLLSSNLARRTIDRVVVYSAAKAGLEGATRALARELGPRGFRVNAVAPGLLRTEMTADRDPAALEAYAREVPLGRIGTAADVAHVVDYLLGERSNYVSGQVVDVDGGWGL